MSTRRTLSRTAVGCVARHRTCGRRDRQTGNASIGGDRWVSSRDDRAASSGSATVVDHVSSARTRDPARADRDQHDRLERQHDDRRAAARDALSSDAGFAAADVQIVGPTTKNHNLVVRYRGTGAHKPMLLLAHLDVVEAKREDWTYDPFVFTRARRLLLRPRHAGPEGRRRDARHDAAPPQAGEVDAGPRLHPRAHGRRRRRHAVQRRRVADQEPPRSDRRRVRDQRRRGRRRDRERQAHAVRRAGRREGLSLRDADGEEPRRTQLAAAEGQRDLRAGARRSTGSRVTSFPAQPNDVVKAYFTKAAATATPAVAADMRSVASGANDAAADRAAEQDAALQRAAAHDVRRDDARGRTRARTRCRRRPKRR